MAVNVVSLMDNLLDKIRTVELISEAEIGPPEVTAYMHKYMNFPAVRMWENGYRPVFDKVKLQGRLRQYDLNYGVFVKNPQDERLSNAYREIIAVEDEIDTLIFHESQKTIVGVGPIIISQSSSGVLVMQQKEVDYYIVGRVVNYKIQLVEYIGTEEIAPHVPSEDPPEGPRALVINNIGFIDGAITYQSEWVPSAAPGIVKQEYAVVPTGEDVPEYAWWELPTGDPEAGFSVTYVLRTDTAGVLQVDETYDFHVRAVDLDGNVSPDLVGTFTVSAPPF